MKLYMKSKTTILLVLAILFAGTTLYQWHKSSTLSKELALFEQDIHSATTCKTAAKIVDQFLSKTGPLFSSSRTRAGIVWGG